VERGISYQYRTADHEVSHGYLKPVIDRFLAAMPRGATVLDMGCGNGSFLSLYRDRGWSLFGTDFSATGIAVAQSNFPGIHFFLADAAGMVDEILHHTGHPDVILSTEVIEHLYDPRAFLRNVHTLIKPGGRFILSTPYHGYLKNLLLAATGKLDEHFTVLWDHGHIKFWSVKTLSYALAEAGFTDIRMLGSGRIPYLWKSMIFSASKTTLKETGDGSAGRPEPAKRWR
jgi:2-polyprenyl-6-hydroxyphenyl methylase/3-demethylubiquinone-9 3-methyltransferase